MPENISYVNMWSQLDPTERAAVLTLTGDGRPTTAVLRLLTAVAGSAIVAAAAMGPRNYPEASVCSCGPSPNTSATITCERAGFVDQ